MPRGFSLIEVLVAMAVMATATLGLTHLLVMSVRISRVARVTTIAAVLAFQKMEQLRTMSSEELTPSPPGALSTNAAGCVEFLDESGRVLDEGTVAPVGAVFVRRWSIDPLPVAETFVLQVAVMPIGAAPGVRDLSRRPEEGRMVGIRRRVPGPSPAID